MSQITFPFTKILYFRYYLHTIQTFFQDFSKSLYMEHVIITDITHISDETFLRKINCLAMQGIEFMKEGMIRIEV